MSVRCPDCGAVASYGNEIGHKSNCPFLRMGFSKLRKMTPEEVERIKTPKAAQETSERRLTREIP